MLYYRFGRAASLIQEKPHFRPKPCLPSDAVLDRADEVLHLFLGVEARD